jgi:hypothetical protein
MSSVRPTPKLSVETARTPKSCYFTISPNNSRHAGQS